MPHNPPSRSHIVSITTCDYAHSNVYMQLTAIFSLIVIILGKSTVVINHVTIHCSNKVMKIKRPKRLIIHYICSCIHMYIPYVFYTRMIPICHHGRERYKRREKRYNYKLHIHIGEMIQGTKGLMHTISL